MSECDEILRRFFEHHRWEKALDGGVGKGINRALLRLLAEPDTRIALYRAIKEGTYEISPPHSALIPKDMRGEWRTVYVNDPADRVILSIANDLLFELMPHSIHPACKSYLSGIGCGKIVGEVSKRVRQCASDVVGWKSDLSKYFDSVPLKYIDQAFDSIEQQYGKSALIQLLRNYYHDDRYIDRQGKIAHKFMSLRQGCAVAAWLADVLLYHIDDCLSQMNGYYVRYSDDMLFVGPDHQRAKGVLAEELAHMGLRINPDKHEVLRSDQWFAFLGFSIRGNLISLSPRRIKKFQQYIERLTARTTSMAQATARVNRCLYRGRDGYSWATQVLPVVNAKQDIDTLNAFVMDAIRAAHTGKRRIGGLGFDRQGKHGCIVRGRGRHVARNRYRTLQRLDGYYSIGCMQNALKTSRAAYETIVRQM